jgi:hypothetical protein
MIAQFLVSAFSIGFPQFLPQQDLSFIIRRDGYGLRQRQCQAIFALTSSPIPAPTPFAVIGQSSGASLRSDGPISTTPSTERLILHNLGH